MESIGKRLVSWGPLGFLIVFTAIAVTGYGYFGLRPENLPQSGRALSFYAVSFQFFGQAHIVLAALVLALTLTLRVGGRWIAALALTATVSFLAEYIGTGYGFPFGAYEYTGLLGFKLGGRVPWVIPLSWFLMGLPSLVLARRAVGDRAHPWVRVVVGAALLTSWDLALDPAMSYLTPYWLWGVEGAFYGMPMINLAGWMFTGILIMLGLERLRVLEWTDHVPSRWWYTYYGVLLAMPLGMVLMAGLWSSVLFTLLAVTLCFLSGRLAAGWSARSPRLAGTPA